MLIVALVMAVIGLAALVTAVVIGNQIIAWVCIAASVIGVILLIVDALRERQRGPATTEDEEAKNGDEATGDEFDADYPDEPVAEDADSTEPADPEASKES